MLRVGLSESNIREVCVHTFKPEFLNRIDDIIVFKSLGKEEIYEDHRYPTANRFAIIWRTERSRLKLTAAARDALFKEGYDPAFGARPLKRAIQKLLADPLALKILEGDIQQGDHILADVDRKGEVVFRPVSPASPAAAS